MRHFLRRRTRTFGRDERGAELIEFGLISILVLTLMFGIMEFGRGIWIYGTVAHLAREGARWSLVRGSESPRTTTPTEVEIYVNSIAAGMTGLTVTTTWDDASKDPGTVVQVRVDKPFTPAVPFGGLGNVTLSSTSRMVIAF